MKLFLVLMMLIASHLALSAVTQEQCKSGPIHDRVLLELEQHLKRWPNPKMPHVSYVYASKNYRSTKGWNEFTVCCAEGPAEPEVEYPHCGVLRTVCFDAETFELGDSYTSRSVNCDSGYP